MARMKVGVLGATGRMGRLVVQRVMEADDLELSGVVGNPSSIEIGQDIAKIMGLGPCGVTLVGNANEVFESSDVLIDFSLPFGTAAYAAIARRIRRPLIVGVTNLGQPEMNALGAAAELAPVLVAANMSMASVVMADIVRFAAERLTADAYDIEILDIHHRDKIDVPSGTARYFGKAAAEGRGRNLTNAQTRAAGSTGKREKGLIGFAAMRGGHVTGKHTVMFMGDGETLEITHWAENRMLFADGAIRAARWLVNQPAGLYGIKDMSGRSND